MGKGVNTTDLGCIAALIRLIADQLMFLMIKEQDLCKRKNSFADDGALCIME